jgi:hypothetical protein
MDDENDKTDYSQGKIYKIVCNKTGLIYIGSTYRSLEQRLKEHISYCKAYIDKRSNRLISSIYVIFNNDYKIELIENYPCQNKRELEKKEYYYISNIDCVNSHRSAMTSKQYSLYRENILKTLIDKCGKDAIIKILFRYGIDEYIKNNKK